MTTGKLVAWGPAAWSAANSHAASHLPMVPDYHQRTATCEEATAEYPANGSSVLALTRRERNMVKPHGSLVPVSLTPHGASTPGLSTWSSTRSLQEPYGSGDLISWRVSRLDAFSVSPFRT